MEKRYWGRKRYFILPLILIAVAAFSAAVMGLWNAILPNVVAGIKPISFLQALGILVLSKILFGGFRGGFSGQNGRKRWMQMKDKFASMTPEEREKWKAEWKTRCGGRWGYREERQETEDGNRES